jgi:hypothetical protein
MKKLIAILIMTLMAFSCKMEEIKPATVETPPKTYTYTASVLTGRDSGTKAVGDTLIIRVNGKIIVSKTGNSIPEYLNFTVNTGDQLSIYMNPGTLYYPHYNPATDNWEDNILDFCTLEATFSGGYYNPYIKFACRCIGKYDGTVKEYK